MAQYDKATALITLFFETHIQQHTGNTRFDTDLCLHNIDSEDEFDINYM